MNLENFVVRSKRLLVEKCGKTEAWQELRGDAFVELADASMAPVERDRFVFHLYQVREEYLRTCETAGKSGKQIERCVIANFRIAGRMAFESEFRQWEDLGSEIDHGWLSRSNLGCPGGSAARDRVSYRRERFVWEIGRASCRERVL